MSEQVTGGERTGATGSPGPVERAADIDPRWMTAALSGSGSGDEVTRLSFAPIGTGQMADSFRFELSYDAAGSAERVPSSVVVKMQAEDELSRKGGASGAYQSEVLYYTELDPTLSIRTPQCYCAIAPDEDGRFALVLEDLAPAEQGDQLKGCGIEQAQLAVVNLAGLHGPRWCDPALRDLGWLRRLTESTAEPMQAFLVNCTERFIEHYGARVPERDAPVLAAFAAKSASWMLGRSERFAPIHGDYRLDNLLFATPSGGSPVAAVDWQTLEVGLPGRDLAYFLGNSLSSDDRRKSEQELVGAYHEALVALGVAGHPLEECFDDYRYGQFHGLFVTVLASVNLTHTDRGDEMFMAMSSRACEAIRDLESLDLL
ncbi:MAG: phosphotransferase [bacterium]|nr:phosphotransferase [bacterium]